MFPIWYVVLCVLAVGITANAVGSNGLQSGQGSNPGNSEDTGLKAIYKRDDTVNSTHDYDLSFNKVNAPLASVSVGGESISVNCLNCQTYGTAQVTSSGINRNESFFKDVTNLVKISKDKGFSAAVADAVDLNMSIDFLNTSGTFDFEAKFEASASHTFNLLTLPVVGLATPIDGERDNVGVILLLDLILNINAATDFVSGFEVSLGNNASVVLDPIGGKILSTSFPGLSFNALPSTVTDPSLTFTASLRATLEVGTTISVDLIIDDVDVSFEAGAFIDLVKYSANVTSAGNLTLSGGSSEMNSSWVTPPPHAINNTAPYPMNSTVSYPSGGWNGTSGTGNGTSVMGKETGVAGNTTSCAAIFQEELSTDIGAFAKASDNVTLPINIVFGDAFDLNKAVTTTLLALPLPTVCL